MTDDACNNQLAAGASAANRDLSASTTAGQREAAPVKEAGLGGVGLLDLTGVHSLLPAFAPISASAGKGAEGSSRPRS